MFEVSAEETIELAGMQNLLNLCTASAGVTWINLAFVKAKESS